MTAMLLLAVLGQTAREDYGALAAALAPKLYSDATRNRSCPLDWGDDSAIRPLTNSSEPGIQKTAAFLVGRCARIRSAQEQLQRVNAYWSGQSLRTLARSDNFGEAILGLAAVGAMQNAQERPLVQQIFDDRRAMAEFAESALPALASRFAGPATTEAPVKVQGWYVGLVEPRRRAGKPAPEASLTSARRFEIDVANPSEQSWHRVTVVADFKDDQGRTERYIGYFPVISPGETLSIVTHRPGSNRSGHVDGRDVADKRYYFTQQEWTVWCDEASYIKKGTFNGLRRLRGLKTNRIGSGKPEVPSPPR